ncbi:hypothetical protein ABW19_dt0210196 [Dactylella cylindrospora]|nr:hypothetical protein ABW19_dt0210196 [Dactylella cylindrospora]
MFMKLQKEIIRENGVALEKAKLGHQDSSAEKERSTSSKEDYLPLPPLARPDCSRCYPSKTGDDARPTGTSQAPSTPPFRLGNDPMKYRCWKKRFREHFTGHGEKFNSWSDLFCWAYFYTEHGTSAYKVAYMAQWRYPKCDNVCISIEEKVNWILGQFDREFECLEDVEISEKALERLACGQGDKPLVEWLVEMEDECDNVGFTEEQLLALVLCGMNPDLRGKIKDFCLKPVEKLTLKDIREKGEGVEGGNWRRWSESAFEIILENRWCFRCGRNDHRKADCPKSERSVRKVLTRELREQWRVEPE